jgi:ubiquinone biosynthesis protein COQ9
MSDWASEAEARLLSAAVKRAPKLGWTSRAVKAAAADAGLPLAEAELLLP